MKKQNFYISQTFVMPAKIFDSTKLLLFTKSHNIKLTHDYLNIKINRDSPIYFICSDCSKEGKKSFRRFIDNPYCKPCTNMRWNASMRQTNMIKYGTEHPVGLPEFQAKSKETYNKKYGKDHPSQTVAFQEKRQKTCLVIYGHEHPSMNNIVKEKAKQTSVERYDKEHPSQTLAFQQRRMETCELRYGHKHPSMNMEVQEKMKQTNLKRYGKE